MIFVSKGASPLPPICLDVVQHILDLDYLARDYQIQGIAVKQSKHSVDWRFSVKPENLHFRTNSHCSKYVFGMVESLLKIIKELAIVAPSKPNL